MCIRHDQRDCAHQKKIRLFGLGMFVYQRERAAGIIRAFSGKTLYLMCLKADVIKVSLTQFCFEFLLKAAYYTNVSIFSALSQHQKNSSFSYHDIHTTE